MSLNKQKGLAAIELTLILPFLFLMLFSIVEFGRLLYQYNALNHLVREAVRYAIIDAVDGSTGVLNISSSLETETENILKYGENKTGLELLPNLANATVSLEASNNVYVTLRVIYPWQPIFSGLLGNLGGSNLSFNLQANYSMRAIGAVE